jgi:hypothetical protein
MATGTLRLHAAAKVTVASRPLTDRELGKPTFLFLPFDARQLSSDERTMDGPLLGMTQLLVCRFGNGRLLFGLRLVRFGSRSDGRSLGLADDRRLGRRHRFG